MSAKDEKPRKSSSASKPKRDPQRQVLSKDQLEKVYDNLDSHKYTTLKWKAIFDTETTKFFKHVKRSTNLTALEIKGSGLAPKHAGDLCQLVDQSRKLICLRIKDHSLDGPSFSQLAACLKTLRLTALELYSPHLALPFDNGFRDLARGLAENTSLTSFKIRGYNISDSCVAKFGSALERNTTLLLLDISDNPISDEGLHGLCKGLQSNSTLKGLILESIGLKSESYATQLHQTLTKHNTTLQRLDINRNVLHGLGALTKLCSIFEAGKLQHIQLAHTSINNEGAAIIFRQVIENSPLRKLHLEENHISHFDVDWDRVSVLTELFLSGNPLEDRTTRQLVKGLATNRSLQVLDLQRCPIAEDLLREFVRVLPSNMTIVALRLKEEMEAAIQRILDRNIAFKNATESYLKSDPVAADSALSKVAFSLGAQTVFLSSLSLTNALNAPVRRLLNSAEAKKATTVLFPLNRFTELPVGVLRDFVHLMTLDVSGNQLAVVPPEIGRLTCLTRLDLHDNRLPSLPSQLGQLTRLTQLLLRNNRIAAVPVEVIENCPLEILNVSGNLVSPTAELVYQLWKSEKLDLSNSNLIVLPTEICSMPRLKELLLCNNDIITLPCEISQLTNLTLLDLTNSGIRHLPWQISELPRLSTLRIHNNPYLATQIPQDLICASDTKQVCEFLRSKQNGSSPCYRAKVMVLGVDSAGKSSLVKAIHAGGLKRTPSVVFDDESSESSSHRGRASDASSTRPRKSSIAIPPSSSNTSVSSASPLTSFSGNGSISAESSATNLTAAYRSAQLADLQITQLVLKNTAAQNAPDLQVDVWEFAGDEKHNISHPFFISKRTVYILVFNPAEPLEPQYQTLDHWLSVISFRAAESPVLLVGTHADSKKISSDTADKLRLQLDARYSPRFPSLPVSLLMCSTKTGKGVADVISALTTEVSKLPGMGRDLPNPILSIEYQLRLLRHSLVPPIISTNRFVAISRKCGLKRTQLANALQTLNELGVIVFVRGTASLEGTSKAFQRSQAQNLSGSGPESRTRLIENSRDSESLESGMLVLEPTWMAQLFRSLVVTKDSYLKNGVLQSKDADLIWRPPSHPAGVAAIYLQLLHKFEMTFPFTRIYGEENAAADPNAAERFLVPLLFPNDPPSGFEPLTALKKLDQPIFTRFYQLDYVPPSLFALFMTRAFSLATPVKYWRSGAILSLSSKQQQQQTAAELSTDHITTIRVSVCGSGAHRLLLHLDYTLQALLLHVFELQAQAYALCTCQSCRSVPDRAHRWRVSDLIHHFLNSNQLAFKCPGGVEVNLKSLAPDITLVLSMTLEYSHLKIGRLLGSGSFAKVYEAVYGPSSTAVAVKELSTPDTGKEQATTHVQRLFHEFRSEAFTWSRLKHPHILQLVGVTIRPLCFVMELATCDTLTHYLSKNAKTISWKEKTILAQDVAKGLLYLHTLDPPIIHRDIKGPNVLLCMHPESKRVMAKLADFGTCFNGRTTVGRVVDNPAWLAPEVMLGKDYGVQADIYSFGIVLWEFSSSALQSPFSEYNFQFTSALEDLILSGVRPTIPPQTPQSFIRLMEHCWQSAPSARPTANEIIPVLDSVLKTV